MKSVTSFSRELGRAELVRLFLSGESARLTEISLESFERARVPGLLVGSLVLVGNFDRAQAIGLRLAAKDPSGVIAFYLSLGYARAGRYDEATLQISHLERAPAPADLTRFYLEQARGFLAFTKGDAEEAARRAQAALSWAEVSRDELQPLARFLALDLLGHSLVGRGHARTGIKSLKLARDAASKIPHQNFKDAVAISILKYEALFGLEPTRVISRLSRALIELKPNDSYSRSELRLELSRQLILRGDVREARYHLEVAAADIMGSRNFLQTAALHLRLAWIARLEGRLSDALFALMSADRGLSGGENAVSPSELSRELSRKVFEFRNEILRDLGRSCGDEPVLSVESKDGSLESSSWIERRLSHRRQKKDFVRGSHVEDPFGDLMDKVAQNENDDTRAESSNRLLTDLMKSGYFGLLFPLLGLNFSQTAIVLGAPGNLALALADGEARLSRGGLGGLLGRLLMRLSEGPCTKREAIEKIWGYSYESDRHDRLLAVAVSRLRKSLGEGAQWVELQGDRVALEDQVVVRLWSEVVPGRRSNSTIHLGGLTRLQVSGEDPLLRARNPATMSPLTAIKKPLRLRQLQVLTELATGKDVGVAELVKKFGISRASALRDLGELVEMKLLVRFGATRATRYVLSPENNFNEARFSK